MAAGGEEGESKAAKKRRKAAERAAAEAAAAAAGGDANDEGGEGGGGDDGEPKEPKEETDEEIARRLHAEFNCAPMRTSRSRRTMDLENPRDGGTPEDPVHDNDPGILPSC